jgi:hypothetical protein
VNNPWTAMSFAVDESRTAHAFVRSVDIDRQTIHSPT